MLPLLLLVAGAASTAAASGDGCRVGCPLALAAYYFTAESNLTFIASLFNFPDYTALLPYNPNITDPNYIVTGARISVPFTCSCLALPADPTSTYLAGSIPSNLSRGESYGDVAAEFANLTTAAWLKATNRYPADKLPASGTIDATINCSCGDKSVSPRYGLFLTYPLWDGETLASAAEQYGFSSPAQMDLLRRYNPGMGGVSGKGIVFIPVKDTNGSYRPLESGNTLSGGAVAGIVIACIVILIVGIWLVVIYYRRQKMRKAKSLPCPEDSVQLGSASQAEGIKVNRSIQFSYEELCDATHNFSMEHKIGQGGFGSVYYAELRGEKAAIKKMDAKATQEFLAELKVLTHVHHLNLVHLIGYCVENCLFLVYEFIENGNLSQHLHGTGYEPLSWTSRERIALDSARGLEYIHEHTVPVYVHRDIKSANILIDKDLRAKVETFHENRPCLSHLMCNINGTLQVADFGLTKLTEIGTASRSLPTRVVGTFGYMPPEYARYGEVSPKVDVYAFGIVLYELISAKEAIVRSTEFTDTTSLVCLFEETLSMPNPTEALEELIDPRLAGDYPVDSVLKMANLAKSCTHEEPSMRPTMRSVVVALMALSSKDNELTRGLELSPRELRSG
ncbi:lysM domain receptor-like kinase 10 isoform X1 [Setaria italica]|uniref:lysM domain receptor-like kinase 10 isoform X1 n=1 Tax=Setaria italica TaxID=4555 RepID=UPI000350E035|nr:lysM domain receptor-like kinase 10 isoform X1 [Setaria italica]XP_034582251.1 lysM domain receptor-like kinase 10 isoform X1 [Setaria viridis]